MMNEQQYIKGFNHGYLLSQHELELINQLLRSPVQDNDYFKGLAHGHFEHFKEKPKEHSVGKSQPLHNKENKHNRDIERDKD